MHDELSKAENITDQQICFSRHRVSQALICCVWTPSGINIFKAFALGNRYSLLNTQYSFQAGDVERRVPLHVSLANKSDLIPIGTTTPANSFKPLGMTFRGPCKP